MPSRAVIDEFLGQKRIAVVGVSRNPKEFTNGLFRMMKEKGYDVVPVNRSAAEVEGVPCYPSVQAVPGPVDGVLVMVAPAQSAAVVDDARAAGVKRVWLYRAGHAGTVSAEAVDLARKNGMALVDGACPYMFLGSWPHKVHRLFTHFDP